MALIGAGSLGNALGANFAVVENTEFKSVCEVNNERGAQVIDKISSVCGKRPERVTDIRRVFDDKDVDGVVVATPEHWHALATVWACQAGKDVYVEKSPSLFVWEGRKMIEASRKYKRKPVDRGAAIAGSAGRRLGFVSRPSRGATLLSHKAAPIIVHILGLQRRRALRRRQPSTRSGANGSAIHAPQVGLLPGGRFAYDDKRETPDL